MDLIEVFSDEDIMRMHSLINAKIIAKGLHNEMKMCSRCYTFKPLTDFVKCQTSKSGRHSMCLQCKKIENKDTYKKMKKKHSVQSPKENEN